MKAFTIIIKIAAAFVLWLIWAIWFVKWIRIDSKNDRSILKSGLAFAFILITMLFGGKLFIAAVLNSSGKGKKTGSYGASVQTSRKTRQHHNQQFIDEINKQNNQHVIDEVNRQTNQQFMDFSMNECMKASIPFDQGGYNMCTDTSFNNFNNFGGVCGF